MKSKRYVVCKRFESFEVTNVVSDITDQILISCCESDTGEKIETYEASMSIIYRPTENYNSSRRTLLYSTGLSVT